MDKKKPTLKDSFPELAKEWNTKKNGITSDSIPPHTNKKYWWVCSVCGYEWEASPNSRTRGNGCPECGKKQWKQTKAQKLLEKEGALSQTHPYLASQWDYEKNKGLTPDEITYHYSYKVHWICERGHKWEAPVNRRATRFSGCPQCSKENSTSFPEQAILYYLSRETKCESRFNYKGKEIDIYLPELSIGIEYDGSYFHNSKYKHNADLKKDAFFKKEGIRIIRVKESSENKIDGDVIYNIPKPDYSNLQYVINALVVLLSFENSIIVDIDKDRTSIYEQYIFLEKENSIKVKAPNIVLQWDYEKNGMIKPEFIRYSSNLKMWWKCSEGHSWQATVYSRYKGNGCPYCAGTYLLEGKNDLLSQNPQLAKEWNYDRNGDLRPNQISVNNGNKVWWVCSKCGYEWESTVAHRNNGRGCPKCARKQNAITINETKVKKYGSLATYKPELLKEWDYDKNKELNPYQITAHSAKKVWWVCSKCGYSWQSVVSSRTSGCGCPICGKKKKRNL